MSLIARAESVFNLDAEASLVDTAALLVQTRQAYWREDPWVNGVVGLVHAENPDKAYVVVYLNRELPDWEVSDDLERLSYEK